MIKTGDNVRFLNAVGGGVVVRVDEKKNLVYVCDEDGFEVPALIRECVVVGDVNKSTNFPRKDFSTPSVPSPVSHAVPPAEKKKDTPEPLPLVETAGGDALNVLLAIFPDDVKQLNTSKYACYLVNDSNYFLHYNLAIAENNGRRSIANGTIEPNIQEWIFDVANEQLNDYAAITVQIIPFKKGKNYPPQKTLDFLLKLNPVQFYKRHSFVETDYFEDPCLLIHLAEAAEKKQLSEISADEIRRAMLQKSASEPKKTVQKPAPDQPLEVDLHINQLLDTTAGMSNADLLNYQLDVVRKTMDEHRNRRGQKIVFIHGKGEGVLRKEVEKLLRSAYKDCFFQDASFREYGFGATMVTIR